ncbi:MAG: tetratricopeptide repeat protein, partial [Flammeovirgaceae bacterium]
MDEKSQQLLDRYIGKLLEMKELKSSQFTQAELKEIALEIGLTEADLKLAKEEVNSHLKRGQTYVQAKDWEAAENEYLHASELDPVNVSTQYQLAAFYFQKWHKTGLQKKELTVAIQQCLELQADYVPAKNLLLKIAKSERKGRLFRRFKRVVAAIVIPILLLATYVFLKEIEVIKPSPTGLEGLVYDVPVAIAPMTNLEGVGVDITRFTIKHDESVHRQRSFDYDYVGSISSETYEVHKLRFKLTFENQNGQEWEDGYLWLFNANSSFAGDENRFTLHPNDHYLFHGEDYGILQYDPAKITKVRLEADRFERFRPAASYPEYPSVPLKWLTQKVDYLDFEVKERDNSYYNDEYGRPRHYLNFEI